MNIPLGINNVTCRNRADEPMTFAVFPSLAALIAGAAPNVRSTVYGVAGCDLMRTEDDGPVSGSVGRGPRAWAMLAALSSAELALIDSDAFDVRPFTTLSSLLASPPAGRATALDAPGSDLYASAGKWAGDPGRFASDTDANYVAYLAAIAAGSVYPAPSIIVGPAPAAAAAMWWNGVNYQYARRPTSQRSIIVDGDSITAIQGTGGWISAVLLQSCGSIVVRNIAANSKTIALSIAGFAADVRPHVVDEIWVQLGTNDVLGTTTPQFVESLKTLIRMYQSTGSLVRLFNIPPANFDVAKSHQKRMAISSVGRILGIPVYDFYQQVIDPATGAFAAAYTNDGVHPNAAGAGLVVASAITQLEIVCNEHRICLPTTSASGGLISNPLMADTNADGIADGLYVSGSAAAGATKTVEASTFGNAQKVAVSSATGSVKILTDTLTVVAGRRYAFVGKAVFAATNYTWDIFALITKNGASEVYELVMRTCVNATGEFYVDIEIPADKNKITIFVQMTALSGGMTGYMTLEQMGLIDVTAMGL